ncbi:MAG: hypothetical protein FJW40_16035 [Acidobacteria bacterium]|nr:hypothetical protein [Acidobacteriota bacterium]
MRHPRVPFRAPVIQRYQGELMRQTGPSCWIFVVEGVADAYQRGMNLNGWNTSLLAAIINLYPRDMDSRELELQTIEGYFTTAVARLRLIPVQHNRIARRAVTRIITRAIQAVDADNLPNVETFMRILMPQDGEYGVAAVITAFQRCEALARDLKVTVRNQPNAEGALLGGRGMTYIGENDDDNDIADALRVNLLRPGATMGVRERLKPRNHQAQFNALTNTYDLTGIGLDQINEGGYHAVMLVSVNGPGRTLVYKDPNYGNASIRITFGQLKRMARFMAVHNQQGVELQSFIDHADPVLPQILGRHPMPVLQPLPPVVVAQPVMHQQAAPQQVVQQPVVHQPVVHQPVVHPPVLHQQGGHQAPAPQGHVPWYQNPIKIGLAVGVASMAAGAASLLLKPAGAPRPPVTPPAPPSPFPTSPVPPKAGAHAPHPRPPAAPNLPGTGYKPPGNLPRR